MDTGDGDPDQILIVWGSAARGDRLAERLRSRRDATVVLATGVTTAASRARSGEFDCVVADHDPTDVDAIELLRSVRAADPRLPVVVSPVTDQAGRSGTTGDDPEPAPGRPVETGASAYVPRRRGELPIDRLGRQIDRMIEERRCRRDRSLAAGRFGALAENLGDAVVVVDADSRIQYANPTLERILGYDPCEVRGESLSVVLPDRYERRHFDGVASYLDTGDRSLDWTGVEFPAVHARGHEVPVEVSFGAFDHDGKRFFAGSIRRRTDGGDATR